MHVGEAIGSIEDEKKNRTKRLGEHRGGKG